jgi:hypothetical protein
MSTPPLSHSLEIECEHGTDMVRRHCPGSDVRCRRRSTITCLLLLYPTIVCPFPLSHHVPVQVLTFKSVRLWSDSRSFEQSRDSEDFDDASDAMNDDGDRGEREDSQMKSTIKSSSVDLTDRFKYKVIFK